jgi:hypothetical protein
MSAKAPKIPLKYPKCHLRWRRVLSRLRGATSVQWGAWSGGGGMAANDAGTIQRMERLGVGAVEPSRGRG